MPHPVIARVHGAVAGFGLSLMCACDLAIAADDAYFTSAYRHIGLTPDGGATWTLPRIVGLRKAMEILLLGERFDASEALRLGLVNSVVSAPELDAAVDAVVKSLAEGPVTAIRNAKRLARASLDRTLSEQLQAEAASFAQCASTADFAEGISAFIAKRKARFGG
jgi:2-(1,2-epoxy-1,2-dihydrophenyl)acetyl-CoA isomerase